MIVNSVNPITYSPVYSGVTAADIDSEETKETAVGVGAVEDVVKEDSFTQSNQADDEEGAITYTPPKKLSAEQIQAMKDQITQSMLEFAEKLLGKQAEKVNKTDFAALAQQLGLGTTPEEAQKAIAEDGMWGVDAVSTRLVDMAISLTGGDPAKAALMREAIQKGFEQAGVALGGELPQISQDTYTETMNRLDYWEANGSMEGYGEAEEEPED